MPTFAGAVLAVELGYRLGAGTMVGSLFGLLAFMLTFTFGLAASRFDARRQLVVEEANAVTTAFLRADLLPTPWAERLREHLRDYVKLRLHTVNRPETLAATSARPNSSSTKAPSSLGCGTEPGPIFVNFDRAGKGRATPRCHYGGQPHVQSVRLLSVFLSKRTRLTPPIGDV